jgi:hypothetical protein
VDQGTGRSSPALRAAVARDLADVFGADTIDDQLLHVYHQVEIRI